MTATKLTFADLDYIRDAVVRAVTQSCEERGLNPRAGIAPCFRAALLLAQSSANEALLENVCRAWVAQRSLALARVEGEA